MCGGIAIWRAVAFRSATTLDLARRGDCGCSLPMLRAGAGSRPGGRGTCSLLRQRKVPKRKATPLPVSPIALSGAGGSLRCSGLGCTAELAAFALRANSARTTAVSQFTMRVSFGTRSPQALRFSARSEGGGSGLHSGHCFARPQPPRCAWPGQSDRAQHVGSAQRVTDTRRSCAAAAVFVPAPYPCWLRREAQELGWVRVPKDTRTSCSSLPMLFERSSKNAASSSAPPQIRASQVAPIAHRAMGDADWGSPSLW